jgi:fructose-specific phosphotransferase system component IIB
MKPSEKVKAIINEYKLINRQDINTVEAILIYLDEEHEKKQFENQNVIENNTFYQINDTPKS